MSQSKALVTIGKSSRTPFKHWILDSELARLVGIFSNPLAARKTPCAPTRSCPFHVIDLCAGDGLSTEHDERSSPSIITSRLQEARFSNVPVKATYIERAPNTFDLLSMNIVTKAPFVELICDDARRYRLPCRKRQPIFVHADPNNIDQWPISEELASTLSETTTMLCTLGCNAGGLKRKSFEERQKWFGQLESVIKPMPAYHDAMLVELQGDASQWAYLLRVPKRWSNATARKIVSAGKKYLKWELSIASWRESRSGFEEMTRRLFLTKTERGVA
jgi:hypothetical protein